MAGSGILHIAQDEKFINAAHRLFEEAFPGENLFVIVQPPANPPIRFLNQEVKRKAHFEITSANTVDKLVDMSSRHRVIVLHGLNKLKGAVFAESPNKHRFMTIIFGAEIYNDEVIGDQLFGEKTKELKKVTEQTTIIDVAKNIYRNIAYRESKSVADTDLKEVLYEMNVFGSLPGFPNSRFVEKEIYNPFVKKIPFSYYPIEFIIKNENLRATGDHILLGNSSSATNNHLEAFDLLKNHKLEGRKIFTPLSYGCTKYAGAVKSYGEKQFPDNFVALTSFMPLEEYNKILSRCGIVIMNHYRPQAMGNIIAQLFMGAKVFLNDTDAYKYFKHLGCHIFLIEKDFRSQESAFQLLTDEQVRDNRKILKRKLSMPALVEKLRISFSEIFGFTYKRKELVQ